MEAEGMNPSPACQREQEDFLILRIIRVPLALDNFFRAFGTALSLELFHVLPPGGVKRVPYQILGFKSFEAEQCTLIGIELMHMFKQRPMVIEGGKQALLRPHNSIPWSPNRVRDKPLYVSGQNFRRI
jgi:hypothetical protein